MTDEVTEPVEEQVVEKIKRPVPDFPLSIALMGAPGSGKAQIIEEFVKIASPFFEENDSELYAIENPGRLIQRDFDQAMGWAGGYREHLWAHFDRLSSEQELRESGRSYVSNGTLIDNIAHGGVEFGIIADRAQESAQLGEAPSIETEMQIQRCKVAMATMTFFLIDGGFRYNFIFHNMLSPKIEIPGQEETVVDRHARKVEAAILDVLDNFQIRIQKLELGTPEEKAQQMFDTIKSIMDQGYVMTPVVVEPEEELEDDFDEAIVASDMEDARLKIEDKIQRDSLPPKSP